MTSQDDFTGLLIAARSGDPDALGRLFTRVYDDLLSRAHRQLATRHPEDTLTTTALVHEVYLKLVDSSRLAFNDRHHFFAVAARAMRQIIVDNARRSNAEKRGGTMIRVDFDLAGNVANGAGTADASASELIALEEAVLELEKVSARLAQIVELRYYAGLSVEETAEVLALSPRTVKRDWRKARAFLFHSIGDADAGGTIADGPLT